jgi:uroporphyrinogen-III decarboxylase
MTSRERLLRTLCREPVDRVPISTYELNGWNPDAWENRAPSYRRLMDKIRSDTDGIYMWGWGLWADSGLWDHRQETLADGSTVTYCRLRTPKGDLTRTYIDKPGVHTRWQTEHLLKTVEDIDRYLSVVPQLFKADESRIPAARESYAIAEERLGDRGVVMNDGGDPSAYVPDLFEFGQFMLMCFQHQDKILELIDAHTQPVLAKFRIDAEEGFGALLRMCGPEYYTPPYMPSEYFRDMVVPGATAAAKILDEGGIFLRLHSHGRVRDALPMIVEIGAKGTDPLEPPPDGDISLAEVKALYGKDLVLFGNTELKVLETAEPEEVRAIVKGQMDAAKEGGGYIMLPTAAPIDEPLSPRTERNYFAWIDAGLEYGQY